MSWEKNKDNVKELSVSRTKGQPHGILQRSQIEKEQESDFWIWQPRSD